MRLTSGKDEIILVTAHGHALRCSESEFRPQGRPASGVTGIGLKHGDQVASMEVVEKGAFLLIVTGLGFGKRTPLEEYPVKGRGGGGVVTLDQKNLAKTGPVAAVRVTQETDEVTIITSGGLVLRLKVSDISINGRATRGMRLIDLAKGDTVASIARIAAVES